MHKVAIAEFESLGDRQPAHALVGEVDLVIVRYDGSVSVLYGRCLHRGALMADGHVEGDNLVCGLHHWDYRLDTGVSRLQQPRSAEQVRRVGRRRQGLGRCRRDRGLGAGNTRSPSTARSISASTPTPATARPRNRTTR